MEQKLKSQIIFQPFQTGTQIWLAHVQPLRRPVDAQNVQPHRLFPSTPRQSLHLRHHLSADTLPLQPPGRLLKREG